MKPRQDMVEAMFSQKSTHTILHESVKEQLDKQLLMWTLGCFFRLMDYLEGSYYDSKNKRIAEFKEHISKIGLDTVIVAIVVAVIRSPKEQTIQRVIGYLQGWMPHECPFDNAVTAGELLSVCSSPNGLFSIIRDDKAESPMVELNHADFINRLFGDKLEWIDTTFFNPPLIEQPKKVINNKTCGYHTIQEPLLLGKGTYHDEKLDYGTINILNNIEWVLDPDVLAEPECSPCKKDILQEKENFKKYLKQSKEVYDLLGDDPFHICWQYCTRGRIYSHGYHVNFQSYPFNRALLNVNHYEYLGE